MALSCLAFSFLAFSASPVNVEDILHRVKRERIVQGTVWGICPGRKYSDPNRRKGWATVQTTINWRQRLTNVVVVIVARVYICCRTKTRTSTIYEHEAVFFSLHRLQMVHNECSRNFPAGHLPRPDNSPSLLHGVEHSPYHHHHHAPVYIQRFTVNVYKIVVFIARQYANILI